MSLKALGLNYIHCINAEKPVLTPLPNPRIPELNNANHQISRLNFSEEAATEDNLPVLVILGAADIQRIKTTEPAVLGSNRDTDPGAECTMLGWIITGKSMLSGTGTEKGFFLKSSHDEFKQMSPQEVLGLTDESDEQGLLHEDLQRLDDWNIFNSVIMEVTLAATFATKRKTDLKKVAKHYTKAGKDGET